MHWELLLNALIVNPFNLLICLLCLNICVYASHRPRILKCPLFSHARIFLRQAIPLFLLLYFALRIYILVYSIKLFKNCILINPMSKARLLKPKYLSSGITEPDLGKQYLPIQTPNNLYLL